jgi:predicted GNAT family acetyltransferase
MDVRVTRDAQSFKTCVFPFLQKDPVLHVVLLAAVQNRATGVHHDPPEPWFASVHGSSGEVSGAAMCSAHRGILLGALAEEFAAPVAAALAEAGASGNVVEGTPPSARAFVERWTSLTGQRWHEAGSVLLYRLGRLAYHPAAGRARHGQESDVDLCTRWVEEFQAEAQQSPGGSADGSIRHWVEGRIEAGHLWLWENRDRPVSLAAHQVPVFGAARIGPVYTPPEHRGRGYAAALTAHVSRQLLDIGSEVCLRTDAAEPIANRLYRRLGYEPVAEFLRMELS